MLKTDIYYHTIQKIYSEQLTFEQNLAIAAFDRYRSFARKEAFKSDYARHYGLKSHWDVPDSVYDETIETLVEIGIIKRFKNGALNKSPKMYEMIGKYRGCEADARRQMWRDRAADSQRAWDAAFRGGLN